MAYDGYRGAAPSDGYPPPHPPYDERDREQPRPASYYPPSSYPAYSSEPARRRASSVARSDSSQPQTIYDAANAVNTAFDRSDAAARVDPELIRQITETVKKEVINSLKKSSIDIERAPSPTSNDSFPTRFTPPSPREFPTRSSNSPDMSSQPRDSFFDHHDTPTPRHVERDAKPRNMSASASSTASAEPSTKARPPPAQREPTDNETTTVEKIWRPLFDNENQPTPRLSQFLRGLANHIIDDYEPKRSIVIPPAKMEKFYSDVKLPDELFPWSSIFKLPNATISKMYRDLRCEHHLIQDHTDKVPHIPALTPDGFRTWMTAMIIAYPELEARRLAKAVLDMPISNADDCKERFPKELPRRLFPKNDNLPAQQRCAAALSCDGRIPVPKTTFPPPPPLQSQSSLERERSPYASTSMDPPMSASTTSSSVPTADSDLDVEPPSIPLERERKPYTAREGTGKLYADDLSGSAHSTTRSEPEPIPNNRHSRTHSVTGPPLHSSGTWPVPPPGTSAPRGTTGEYPPSTSAGAPPPGRHYRTNSTVMNGGRRPRSPSFSAHGAAPGSYGTRSEGNVGDIPQGYYTASNINMYDADDEIRKREYAQRRQAEEDAARYGSRSIYDDDYYRGRGGSNGYSTGNGNGYGHGYGGSTRY